ncbi:MAG: nitrate/nitrite transporter NrtS [Fuerstiella sp.]|jgi:hypothetical protein|nr:nitrate/nitrite transporter NrtS [Fuerstiella sp.]
MKNAFQWPVVRRALILAVIVGTLLIGINHGSCIARGHFNSSCLVQSVLTFLVPYFVSTVSSVLTMSDHAKAQHDESQKYVS